MSGPVLIAAGGTGGHIFPALAVAEALRRRGRAVTILTDRRGASFVGAGWDVRLVRSASPAGGLSRKLLAGRELLAGAWQSRRLLAELRPAATVCFGGYASVPAALAARLSRTPLLLHEQNAVLGKANRWLARLAGLLALSFEATRAVPAGGPGRVVTGNPVRPGFAGEPAPPRQGGKATPFRLLVLGGSQGAAVFGTLVPAAVALLPPALRGRLTVVQQCRAEDLEAARAAYAATGVDAELAPFFTDVPERLAAADLVVCRSGASTAAELLALAKPAILVPYPHAADGHQDANAASLASAGAVIHLPQPEATPAALAAHLTRLMTEPARLAAMATAAAGLARPDAAERLVDAIFSLERPGAAP